MAGSRSHYGATKLASELMIEEYRDAYGLRAVINRCGVLAGPWQFGKVDQGFIALWMARHLYGGPLAFTGFGGGGLQVRECSMSRISTISSPCRRNRSTVGRAGSTMSAVDPPAACRSAS